MNIWRVLLRLREEGYAGLLWIDAICINQEDVAERGWQVALMGRIYQNAQNVHAWLGPGHGNGGVIRAIENLIWLYAQYDDLSQHREPSLEDWDWEDWQDMLELCNVEYWSRLWIVQEFVISRNVFIRCGNLKLEVGCLHDFERSAKDLLWRKRLKKVPPTEARSPPDIYYNLSDLGLDDLELPFPLRGPSRSPNRPSGDDRIREIMSELDASTTMSLVRQRLTWRNQKGLDWMDVFGSLVYQYSDSECLDPRDHIYGLLPLVTEAVFIVPDYSRSASDIFLDIFNMLRNKHDIARQKGIVSGYMRGMGNALRLSPNDATIIAVFQEIGVGYVEDEEENGV